MAPSFAGRQQEKTPRRVARGSSYGLLDLGANVGRSRTLGARLSYETDLDSGIQAIEIDAAAAMEEVVVAVFRGDKPESALGDELLNGSRHWCEPPFPNVLPRAVEACSSGAHGERTPNGCTLSVTQCRRGSNYGKGLSPHVPTTTRARPVIKRSP